MLELVLFAMFCINEIATVQEQGEKKLNWIEAYKKYVSSRPPFHSQGERD